MPELTQEYLKQRLHYDHDTGVFTWVTSAVAAKAGDSAWHCAANGYVAIMINRKPYYAHRLAWLYMTGEWPTEQIDHINHVKSDNRFFNLREVTHSENQRNRTCQSNNTSGATGVSWEGSRNKWRARIRVNGKQVHVGRFDCFEAACDARKDAEAEYGFHPNHGVT